MYVCFFVPVFVLLRKHLQLFAKKAILQLIHPKVSLILATDMATHFDFLGKFRVRSLRATDRSLDERFPRVP